MHHIPLRSHCLTVSRASHFFPPLPHGIPSTFLIDSDEQIVSYTSWCRAYSSLPATLSPPFLSRLLPPTLFFIPTTILPTPFPCYAWSSVSLPPLPISPPFSTSVLASPVRREGLGGEGLVLVDGQGLMWGIVVKVERTKKGTQRRSFHRRNFGLSYLFMHQSIVPAVRWSSS